MIVPLSVIGLKLWYINIEGGEALVLQVAQWYSSCVPSLYPLVFYHCIHNSQSVSAPFP